MSSEFVNYFSSTLIGSILGGRSRNNKYISQPDFTRMPLDFNQAKQWTTITGNEREVYLTTPELKLVVDRLALMFSNGIWKHLDKNGDPIENSPFVQLLENPNVFQSRNEYLFQWFVQRSIYANVFVYNLKGFQLQEVPTALWNLSPSRMIINRTGKIWQQTELDQIISSYTFDLSEEGKQSETYTTEDIIQFSMPDCDDPLKGNSPLEALRMPISNIRLAYGYHNVILAKKGALGVWSSDSKDSTGSVQLTTKEQTKVSESILRNQGIGDHQNSIAVSNKALKFTPATFPTKDLLLNEQIEANMKRIIDTLGGNENMFSSKNGSKYDNIQGGEKLAYQDTIIPVSKDLANGFSKRWGLLDKGEMLVLDYDHLPVLQEDEVRKSQVIERKSRAAQILLSEGMPFTADEVKLIIGFDEGK